MKEQTKKNILLVFICIITLAILFISLKINYNKINNDLSLSSMKGYLTEINYEEISTHVIEQPKSIMYVSNSSDIKSKNFEKIFKGVIKEYNLENDITYININDKTIVDPIYQNAPELIFYKDGKIYDMIDCSTLSSKNKVVNVLKERSVISD